MKRIRTYWTGPEIDSESYINVPQEADRVGLSINDMEVEIDLNSLELIIRDSSTLDEFLRFDTKTIEGVFE